MAGWQKVSGVFTSCKDLCITKFEASTAYESGQCKTRDSSSTFSVM